MYAAYGWLLLGGVLHFGINVVAQFLRGKRVPGRETTLFYGLNTSYALGQMLVGTLAVLILHSGNAVLVQWPGITLGLAGAAGWLAICLLFLEYKQPRGVVLVFAVLLGIAALTS